MELDKTAEILKTKYYIRKDNVVTFFSFKYITRITFGDELKIERLNSRGSVIDSFVTKVPISKIKNTLMKRSLWEKVNHFKLMLNTNTMSFLSYKSHRTYFKKKFIISKFVVKGGSETEIYNIATEFFSSPYSLELKRKNGLIYGKITLNVYGKS